jgi:hypothetical protein
MISNRRMAKKDEKPQGTTSRGLFADSEGYPFLVTHQTVCHLPEGSTIVLVNRLHCAFGATKKIHTIISLS